MILPTRRKIALARLAYHAVMAARRLLGRGYEVEVRRAGVSWLLDLREGIDFAIYLTGAFEPATGAAYRRLIRPGDIAVDVGANIGAHTLPLARAVGERGRVLAYEPAARAFARLRGNIERNPDLAARIHARQAMLVDDLTVPLESAVYASWPLSPTSGAHHLHLGVAISTDGAHQLLLDQAVADAGVDHVSLVKLDVDGHELQVLRGGRQILRQSRPTVIMELAPYTLEERGQDPAELIAFLRELKYTFCDLSGRPLAGPSAGLPMIAPGSSLNVIAHCSRS